MMSSWTDDVRFVTAGLKDEKLWAEEEEDDDEVDDMSRSELAITGLGLGFNMGGTLARAGFESDVKEGLDVRGVEVFGALQVEAINETLDADNA